MRRLLSSVLAACAAVSLCACADMHLQQRSEVALVRTGSTVDKSPPRGPVAARLLPYALLAEQAKFPEVYAGFAAHPAPHSDCSSGADACAIETRELDRWRLIYAADRWDEIEEKFHLACPTEHCLDGLGVQVWVSREQPCPEAVISFRGSRRNLGNWVSNFHWLSRYHPDITDQYGQVSLLVGKLIDDVIVRDACYTPATRITAVGHSLGGGLAQHANYQDGRIDRIYGFNPSFVTGSMDFPASMREQNAQGLIVERVYEHGEILELPRWALRKLRPLPDCNPRVVSVRFNMTPSGYGGQHKISELAQSLLKASEGSTPEADPVATEPCS